MLSGLICYDERRFVSDAHLQMMSGGMLVVLIGCAFVGSRRALRCRCTTDEHEDEARVGSAREALLPKSPNASRIPVRRGGSPPGAPRCDLASQESEGPWTDRAPATRVSRSWGAARPAARGAARCIFAA